MQLIPYNANLDPESHNFLPWLWDKLKADKLISIYFHDRPDVNFPTLVKLFSGGTSITLVFTGEGKEAKMIGFGALTSLSDKAASAGFAFFREFWDTKTTTEALKALLTYWFKQFELDSVLGGVAEGNRAANIMLSRAGCKRQGKLPHLQHWKGLPSDAVVWAAYRADFPGKVN